MRHGSRITGREEAPGLTKACRLVSLPVRLHLADLWLLLQPLLLLLPLPPLPLLLLAASLRESARKDPRGPHGTLRRVSTAAQEATKNA